MVWQTLSPRHIISEAFKLTKEVRWAFIIVSSKLSFPFSEKNTKQRYASSGSVMAPVRRFAMEIPTRNCVVGELKTFARFLQNMTRTKPFVKIVITASAVKLAPKEMRIKCRFILNWCGNWMWTAKWVAKIKCILLNDVSWSQSLPRQQNKKLMQELDRWTEKWGGESRFVFG